MKLRVAESSWSPFCNALRRRTDVESAGILLAERVADGRVLVGRELLVVPDEGYLIRKRDQLRIDPVALNRMIRPARDRGLSVLTVHTHPGTREPWFSLADDAGDSRLMPSLSTQTPGPHGSLVVAGDSGRTSGRVWHDNGQQMSLRTRVVGRTLGDLDGRAPDDGDPCFDRQRLALGTTGQAALKALSIGVVGLGGTGSAVLVQLAHLGVGSVTLIDGDLVEASNVSRIHGARRRDIGRTAKVDVAARYLLELDLGTDVRVVRSDLGPENTNEIWDCDVVFSCVDRHRPRALLNRFSYEQLVPVIDMGSAFRVDADGRVVSSAGRVVVVGPDRPCLCCWGHIDPDRLRTESLPERERAAQAAEGYVVGADIPEPSVIATNTAIAGAAVVEFLRLATAFAGADEPPLRLAFDFATGSVRRNRLPDGTSCTICRSHQCKP